MPAVSLVEIEPCVELYKDFNSPSPYAYLKPQVRGKLPGEELANSTKRNPFSIEHRSGKEGNHAQVEGICGTPEADTRDKEAVQCVAYKWWCQPCPSCQPGASAMTVITTITVSLANPISTPQCGAVIAMPIITQLPSN